MIGSIVTHYRIIGELGGGGMGVVYRAEDMRLGRQVAIKFLPDSFVDQTSHDRFQREARAASALNHTHICTVYDVGEHEGSPFLVMELLEGHTLRTVIGGKPLPLAKTLDYAAQIAEGLAAAHAQNIVHRDIKPANLFVTNEGPVKILDFGLAKVAETSSPSSDSAHPTMTAHGQLTRAGSTLGTVSYMSPEQTRGEQVDVRSDLFSLGVVIYEMATGTLPFRGNSDAEVFSSILRDHAAPTGVHPELDRILAKALEKDREIRYQSARDLRADLKRLQRDSSASHEAVSATASTLTPAPPAPKSRRALYAAAVACAVLMAAAGYWGWQQFHRPLLSDKDTIIISEFVNTTGDTAFDGALKQALTTQLEESSYLSIISEERLRRALTFMGKPQTERVTRDVSRQICEREAIKAIVNGGISLVGSHYLVALEAVACANGESLAREQEEVDAKEKTLQALAKASTRLRVRLGDSLARVKAPVILMESQVTTASLEAYKQFALGEATRNEGKQRQAIPFYQRAIEMDPGFAMAYARMAVYYSNFLEFPKAVEYITKAYALRDRVSDRERLYITAHYQENVTGDLRQLSETYEQYMAAYPRSFTAPNNLAYSFMRMGEYEKALVLLRKAQELEPKVFNPYGNMMTTYIALNRRDEARAIAQEGARNGLDIPATRSLLLEIAYLEENLDEVKRQEDWLRPRIPQHPGTEPAAEWNGLHGRFRKAAEWYAIARADTPQDRPGAIARVSSAAAMQNALFGDCAEVHSVAARALGMYRGEDLLQDAGVALALCGGKPQAEALAKELGALKPQGTLANNISLPSIHAALAIKAGQPQTAITELQAASPFERAYLTPVYLRAMAYLQMKSGPAAAAEFQKIIDHRGAYPNAGRVWAAAHVGLARAQAISGNVPEARKTYQQFFDLWKDADTDIPLLSQAKAEFAKLQ